MVKIIIVCLIVISSALYAMTTRQIPSGLSNRDFNPNEDREDIQEEVDLCFDSDGKELPGCSEKAIRNKIKAPNKSKDGARDRFNQGGVPDSTTTNPRK